MEGNSGMPAQGEPSAADAVAGDWRTQLQCDARQRIVNKIMDTLKGHLPTMPEGLNELQKIAVRFEEKIYSAATTQSDYLRKISLKMLSMTMTQNALPINPSMPNTAIPNQNPTDPGVTIGEPVTTLSLNTHNKRERILANNTTINCDLELDQEEENDAKKRIVMKSNLEPEKVVAKEPIFTCPVCMDPLVEASSTICGHIFCDSCIKASIKAQKKCPTCRRKLTMNNFHRVYLPTVD